MNAESELEAVGMAWGAAATGTPAATGSTGQGLSLMQESLAEIDARPHPARRAQHGPGPGRLLAGHPRAAVTATTAMPVLAPMDVPEAVDARRSWRSTSRTGGATRCWSSATTTSPTPRSRSTSTRVDRGPLRSDDWALDGRPAAPATRRLVSPLGTGKQRDDVGYDLTSTTWRARGATDGDARRHRAAGRDRVLRRRRGRRRGLRHARRSTCAPRSPACGPTARASATCGRSRCSRSRREIVADAADGARAVAVYENNQGQMIDDVRLAVLGAARCTSSGG